MLGHLHIRHFAIVDDLELDLDGGMTVLTGETGAGKSILLDALGLALGDRADSSVVRPGAERAEISADFGLERLGRVADWLREQELDADGECLVRRTIGGDGRSRGFINGHPVPVQKLRELGEQLVDIHSQHAHQALLRRDAQRQILDDFAGHAPLLNRVADAFRAWKALHSEWERLREAGSERDSRLEMLRYQVEELTGAAPRQGEIEELDEEHGRLANASRLLAAAERAVSVLYEAEEAAVRTVLGRTRTELAELRAFDGRLANAVQLVEGAVIQVDEAAAELRHYLAGLEIDPQRLAAVEQRLGVLHDLARKHRVPPGDLPDRLGTLQAELHALEQADMRREQIEQDLARAEQHYLALVKELSAARRQCATRLAEQVGDNMRTLGLREARFSIAVDAQEGREYGPHGLDRVEFLVSANPGQPLNPLSKVASGGELSRISLAIQVIVAGRSSTPTLIFDEVDVGVGGGVAEMVGRQLHQLGERTQVLCVTHQPQVAALGRHHLKVTKQTADGVTRARIDYLGPEQRVMEIARMLGGVEITEQTTAHAREMLSRAQRPAPKSRQKA